MFEDEPRIGVRTWPIIINGVEAVATTYTVRGSTKTDDEPTTIYTVPGYRLVAEDPIADTASTAIAATMRTYLNYR